MTAKLLLIHYRCLPTLSFALALSTLVCSPGPPAPTQRPAVVVPRSTANATTAPPRPDSGSYHNGKLLWVRQFASSSGDESFIDFGPKGEVRWFHNSDRIDLGGGRTDDVLGTFGRFTPDGRHVFSVGLNLAGSATAMVSAPGGDVYFTGAGARRGGGYGGYLSRVTPAAQTKWTVASSGYAIPEAVGVDREGRVVICGYFHGTISWGGARYTGAYAVNTIPAQGQPSSLFVASFNADGRLRWSRAWDHVAAELLVQPDGRILLAGYVGHGYRADLGGGPVDGPRSYVASFDADGGYLGGFTTEASPHRMAVDRAGATLMTGIAHGAFGLSQDDAFLVRLDHELKVRWTHRLPRAWSVWQLWATAKDHIVIGGTYRNQLTLGALTVEAEDAYAIAKLDAAGRPLWLQSVQGAALSRIAVDGAGRVLMSAWFERHLEIGDRRLEGPDINLMVALFGS